MLLHLSTDQIICLLQGKTHILPYQRIEQTFGPRLHNLLTTHKPSDVYVLNGPGSFTTLRVCCLAINLLLPHHHLKLFTTSKPELFSRLYEISGFPKKLAMTIGQKKNCRRYDCSTKTYEKITFTERQDDSHLLLDPVVDKSLVGGEIFAKRVLNFSRDDNKQIVLSTDDGASRLIDLTAPCRQPVSTLTPNYLIEPTMG